MAEFQLLVDDVVIKKFSLDKAVTSIGRLPTSDIVIDEDPVSGEHARIEFKLVSDKNVKIARTPVMPR